MRKLSLCLSLALLTAPAISRADGTKWSKSYWGQKGLQSSYSGQRVQIRITRDGNEIRMFEKAEGTGKLLVARKGQIVSEHNGGNLLTVRMAEFDRSTTNRQDWSSGPSKKGKLQPTNRVVDMHMDFGVRDNGREGLNITHADQAGRGIEYGLLRNR